MTPIIEGALAVTLRTRGFRPSRPRPDTVWTFGRANGARTVAILEPDGRLTVHRHSARRTATRHVDDAANAAPETIQRAVQEVVRA